MVRFSASSTWKIDDLKSLELMWFYIHTLHWQLYFHHLSAEHPVGDLLLMVMSTKIVNPLKVWANATQINTHYVIMFNFTRTTKPYTYLMGTNSSRWTMWYWHTMTCAETFEVPLFHGSLETLSDPTDKFGKWDQQKRGAETYEFATTSTNWPGTKWTADKVVPMQRAHQIMSQAMDVEWTYRLGREHLEW